MAITTWRSTEAARTTVADRWITTRVANVGPPCSVVSPMPVPSNAPKLAANTTLTTRCPGSKCPRCEAKRPVSTRRAASARTSANRRDRHAPSRRRTSTSPGSRRESDHGDNHQAPPEPPVDLGVGTVHEPRRGARLALVAARQPPPRVDQGERHQICHRVEAASPAVVALDPPRLSSHSPAR